VIHVIVTAITGTFARQTELSIDETFTIHLQTLGFLAGAANFLLFYNRRRYDGLVLRPV